MKNIVGVLRIFVGVFFIISGFIKLNDPVGFSFKLKDYFAPDVLNLEFLVPYALVLALFVVIFEVLLGVFLILGYLRKFTLWSLLLLIVFFTFLTFYSAYFNKVTDCGCFGDALKLTPWQSFYKDVVLLLFILVLFKGKQYLKPFFSQLINRIKALGALLFCLIFSYYVLMHLPVIDFRAYKIGVNIPEGMAVPENAPKAIYEYKWKFSHNNEEIIITTLGDYPASQEGTFIDVSTKLVQKGYEPPIHDFSIEKEGDDFTETFLSEEKLLLVIAYSIENTENEGYESVRKRVQEAVAKGYKVIGLSASSDALTTQLKAKHNLDFPFYFTDETTLKTIVRSNPGVLSVHKGTIHDKRHWNDAHKLKLN